MTVKSGLLMISSFGLNPFIGCKVNVFSGIVNLRGGGVVDDVEGRKLWLLGVKISIILSMEMASVVSCCRR